MGRAYAAVGRASWALYNMAVLQAYQTDFFEGLGTEQEIVSQGSP